MELKLVNLQGQNTGVINVSEAVFGREYNEALVHQVVTAYLANARSGERKQKTRAEVSHSTKKPWRQKGTGRARAGTTSSPIWRGGGRAFPNTPDENFSHKVNRKMYRAGIAAILSKLVADNRLVVADDLIIDAPKTKSFVTALKNLSVSRETVLVVVSELSENVYYASRNLPEVLVLEAHQIDPYSLLRCNKVIFTQQAIQQVQEQWACLKHDLYKVLISPMITEKANTVAEKNEQVVFKVLKNATKQEIKAAFELAFNAQVTEVRVLNVQGKAKKFGRINGRRDNWKKAYISLKPGQSFDLAANQK